MSTLQTTAIRSAADISPALGLSLRHGGLIVTEANLCSDFFNLRTGFAGEVLQKFTSEADARGWLDAQA